MIQAEASGVLFRKTKITVFRSFLQQPLTVITFNWASILFISFFLAYGYFGAKNPEFGYFQSHLASSILKLVFLAFILTVLGILAWKKPNQFQDSIQLYKQDALIFFSYFAIFFSLSFSQLQFSLFSDEISYAATSHGQSFHILLALAPRLDVFANVPFQYMVQFVSVALLLFLLTFYFLLKRLEWKLRITICVFALIGGRVVVSLLGGNGSPHPPLNFIPPFISGSILGITDFSFKFSFFGSYIIFIFVLYRILQREFPVFLAYLLALSIGTIPLLLHLSAVVEHSLWASICFTLVLAEIVTTSKINYLRLVSIISIATMMRQPSFLAIIPVVILFFVRELESKNWWGGLKRLSYVFFPVVLFIPFVGTSLLYGTPATEGLAQSVPFERILNAVFSNIIWVSIVNSLPYWWVVFIPFAFIPLSRANIDKHMALFIFFTMTLCAYYSIHSSLWGYAKYQAEYVAPIAISGILFLLLKFSAFKYSGKIFAPLFLIIILLNVVEFIRIPFINKSVDVLMDSMSLDSKEAGSGYYVLSAFPFNYHDAYNDIKKNNFSENTYSLGATYGVFPEIMNGYSLKSILAVNDIYLKQLAHLVNVAADEWNVGLVENDYRIKVILLGSIANKPELIKQFLARGWQIIGEYGMRQYGSTVVVMQRPV